MEKKDYHLPDSRGDELVYGKDAPVQVVTNSDLQCGNCVHSLSKAGICKKYRPKPDYVLLNKGACPSFETITQENTGLTPDDGSTARVVHTPQCVDCGHNQGGFACAVFVRKPEELLMNERDCPARTSNDN